MVLLIKEREGMKEQKIAVVGFGMWGKNIVRPWSPFAV